MERIAIDVGGTHIKGGIIDTNLTLKDKMKIETPNNIDAKITDAVFELVQRYIDKHHLSHPQIGISTAGVVDESAGRIVYTGPTIPNFNGTNFKALLAPFSKDVHVYNDVNAALLGELSLYEYDAKNIFCLTLGTGIGGAFYDQHSGLYNGARNRANEIGYLLYRSTDETTYELRGSVRALKQRMQAQHFEYGDDVIKLFELAIDEGDSKAHEILNAWSEDVADGIAQIQILYDPELILIGGGISSQGERLLRYITPKVAHYLPPEYGHARIQTMQTQNDAALYGAVAQFQ